MVLQSLISITSQLVFSESFGPYGQFQRSTELLGKKERHVGSSCAAKANRTKNEDSLIQVCFDHRLFLQITNVFHVKRHWLFWRHTAPSLSWTQIDWTENDHRWRGSAENCQSFQSPPTDSHHALIHACFCLYLIYRPTKKKTIYLIQISLGDTHRHKVWPGTSS